MDWYIYGVIIYYYFTYRMLLTASLSLRLDVMPFFIIFFQDRYCASRYERSELKAIPIFWLRRTSRAESEDAQTAKFVYNTRLRLKKKKNLAVMGRNFSQRTAVITEFSPLLHFSLAATISRDNNEHSFCKKNLTKRFQNICLFSLFHYKSTDAVSILQSVIPDQCIEYDLMTERRERFSLSKHIYCCKIS